MPAMKRKDFDDELAAWLEQLHAEQSTIELDQFADLWLANDDAKAIKDPRSPAAKAEHEKINAILTRMGL